VGNNPEIAQPIMRDRRKDSKSKKLISQPATQRVSFLAEVLTR